MADEVNWHDLSERDIPILTEAFRRAMQRDARGEPVIDRPPVVAATDADIRRIVREENATLRINVKDDCRDLIEEEAEKVAKQVFVERMAFIGLRLDNPDQVEKVQALIAELKRDQENKKEFKTESKKVFLSIAGGWLAAIIAAFAAFLGYRGGGH